MKTENAEKQPPVVPPEESPDKAVDLLPELTIHHQEIARLIAVAYRSAKETLPQPPANVSKGSFTYVSEKHLPPPQPKKPHLLF